MADSATTTVSTTSPSLQSPSAGQTNGPPIVHSHPSRDGRGRGSSRGSRGQRGGRTRGRASSYQHTLPRVGHAQRLDNGQPPGSPPDGGFGTRLTRAASQIQDDLGVKELSLEDKTTTPEEAESDICFICASKIEHTSIAPCNHQTCHICSLRLRALYKTKACAHCRTEADFVIFTDNAEKRYEDFADEDFVKVDDNLGIKFEKQTILDDTILLLRYNCPDKDCDVQCLSWPDLHRHVKSKHGKIMCNLCTRHKKVFTHEHELFSYGELRRHEKFGDDNPGAIDQSGFKGHPECGFCRQRFYGDDELYTHCRERHERCHICDRRNPGGRPQYYLNYQELEKHFQEAHFVCIDPECQANKTNVFESELDLKAHQLSEHPNPLSKDARRDARMINLSGFDIRTPYLEERRNARGERDRRGWTPGRDPGAEPLPSSSAQPIGRAELAYQRQMALLNAPTSTGRTFRGQLTSPTSTPAQPQPQPRGTPPPQAVVANLDTLAISDASQTSSTAPQTPQEKARAARHAAVISRAVSLLGSSGSNSITDTKMNTFRELISSYRTSSITARDLVDQFATSLFPSSTSPSELGKLVRELADLFESETKCQQLLEAWNDWRSINDANDYPTLPLPSGASSSSFAGGMGGMNSTLGAGGRRVLRLKNSTAQSGRGLSSAVNRATTAAWRNPVAPGSTLSHNPFPPLAAGAAKKPVATTATSVVWGARPSSSSYTNNKAPNVLSSSTSSTKPNPTNSSAAPRAGPIRVQDEMFPSLPAARKPDTLMAGLTRGSVRWDDGRRSPAASNPWALAPTPAQAASSSSNTATAAGNVDGGGAGDTLFDGGNNRDGFGLVGGAGDAGRNKKKGKKGKQVLYHFG